MSQKRSHSGYSVLLVVLGILSLSTLGWVLFYHWLNYNPGHRIPFPAHILGYINRFQQVNLLEKGEFIDDISKIDVGIKYQDDKYHYIVRSNHLSSISYAIPQKKDSTGYAGGAFIVAIVENLPEMVSIVCQTQEANLSFPKPPRIVGNEIRCGEGTELFSMYRGLEPNHFKISHDAVLAHQAAHQMSNNQVQQALKTVNSIRSSSLKNYVLAAIAKQPTSTLNKIENQMK